MKNTAPIHVSGQDFDFYRDATGFVYQDTDGLLDLPLPKLNGDHQLGNAAVAIAAIRAGEIEVSDQSIEKGMKSVVWPGRLERLPEGTITAAFGSNANILIDGGHNPAAGEVIASELLRHDPDASRKILLVCGMINTKEPAGYFNPFTRLDTEVIAIPVAMSDAGIAPEELADAARKTGLKASAAGSLEEGVQLAARFAEEHPGLQIIFCGSLYMVGEVLGQNGTPPQ